MKKAGAVLAFALAVTPLFAWAQTQQLRRQETLAKLNLSASELKQVIAGVEAAAFDSPDSWEKELLGRRISLGAAPGLVLQGTNLLCGGTGNCQIFVFRKVGQGWAPLFASEQAPVVEGFSFGPEATRGVKDLHVQSNSSADKSSSETYRFDGKFYRPAR
jgi:hypothetical protein